ncbi:MAG: diacylglycerol kinase [Gammaproteobacteria bacterium]|nr:diacylglycerol kinase [Gammaproteobacteria bacterium]
MDEATYRKSRGGIKRVWYAAGYSLSGLVAAFRHEAAFRQELAVAAVLLPLAVVLPRTWLHSALLIASVMLVLVIELVNSAVEAAVDRVSGDHHELAKRAKDIGSAAVCLSLVNCGVVWLIVLVEEFLGV